MQRFKANATWGRYRLVEELSVDPATGQQVWAVFDTTTNQRLIGRFWGDGQVEWYTDNRPIGNQTKTQESPTEKQPHPTIGSMPRRAPDVSPSLMSPLRAVPRSGSQLLHGLALLFLVALGVAGYVQRGSLRALFSQPAGNTAPSVYGADSANAGVSVTMTPSPLLTDGRWTLEQANNQLRQLAHLTPGQHATAFAKARESFSDLRATSLNETYMDSLSQAYARMGALSRAANQQNGDSVSKWYALQWYQLAHTLNPQPQTEALVNQLKGISLPRQSTSRPARARRLSPGFMPDPELNP